METTELAVVNAQNAVQIFTQGGLDAVLAGIEERVRAIPMDVSTATGRDVIRSTAYKVARTKTALDAEAKALTEGWRDATKKVNEQRKISTERLDALADEVRAPLTEFENKEKTRTAAHEAAITEISGLAEMMRRNLDMKADLIEEHGRDLSTLHSGRDWQEFSARATRVRAEVTEYIALRLESRRKFDAYQAELERLRAAEAEQLTREREERIRAEAAEKARLEAERQAKAEADAEARRVIEASNREAERVRAEAAKVQAEHERVQKEAEAARRKEEDARLLAERRVAEAEAARLEVIREAEADRLAAERKAAQDLRDAQEKAQRDAKAAADAAVAAERERAEKDRKAREQKRPAAIMATLRVICDGYAYNPGDSDLDDVQPIHVSMTLGDYRRASQLRHELEGK